MSKKKSYKLHNVFPSIHDSNIIEKLTKKREFVEYKIDKRSPAELYNIYNGQNQDVSSKSLNVFRHTPQQKFLRNFMGVETPYRGLLIIHGTGVGKCHARGTKLLLESRKPVNVEDVTIGTLLMGDDSTPRKVLSLAHGRDAMFKIIPICSSFNTFTVNGEHILCLKSKDTGAILEISVNRYLEMKGCAESEWQLYRRPITSHLDGYHTTYSAGFEFNESVCKTTILEEALCSPIHERFEFLAGLIDSIYSKTLEEVIDSINCGSLDLQSSSSISTLRLLVLSVGLGFADSFCSSKGQGPFIFGNLAMIKTRCVALSKTIQIDTSTSDFTIKKDTDIADYYGFTLDGNGRYMLANDLTITHNTCSAISIAEQYKRQMARNGKHIYIIRHEEFQSQIFDVQKVAAGSLDSQCTGHEYLDELDNKDVVESCLKRRECEALQAKVSRIMRKYYDFSNIETWARMVKKLITKKNANEEDALAYKIKQIRNLFNNGMIIIDEAHHINDESNDRTISKVLTDVLTHSENLRLVMLSATPMFDKPEDIITLINYLLMNDKRPLLPNRIFGANGLLTEEGAKILRDNTRGYISYLRGNNPFDFPLRLSARVNLPTSAFVDIKKYPSIPEEYRNVEHKMQFLDLVNCKMGEEQRAVYEAVTNNRTGAISTAYNEESQVSNFIYQTLEEANGNVNICYGDAGFRALIKDKKAPPYQFHKPEFATRFLMPELSRYSSKISKILDLITTAIGPVFIFTQWIDSGVYPLLIALEMNGYRGYKGATFIESSHKSSEVIGEYVVRSGSYSTPQLNKYIAKREAMIKEPVKVFIATAAASEGLNLFGYREAYILDPHFNLSRLEQAVGRTIRYRSHMMLPATLRNVSVYMLAATLPKTESIDLYKYRKSELKGITTGQVELILKENAVDCMLNYDGNSYRQEDYPKSVNVKTSQGKEVQVALYDQPFSRACHYAASCDFKCTTGTSSSDRSLETLQMKHLTKDIEYVAIVGTKLVREHIEISLDELRKYLQISGEAFDIGITKILDDSAGTIVLHNSSILRVIPDYYKDSNLEYQTQYKGIDSRIVDLDLRNYITKLQKYRDTSLEHKESNYANLLKELSTATNAPHDGFSNYEVIEYLFQRFIYQSKVEVIQHLFPYIYDSTYKGLSDIERLVIDCISRVHLIYFNELYANIDSTAQKQIYGAVIAKGNRNVETFVYQVSSRKLIRELAVNRKYIEHKRRILLNQEFSKVYGYMISDRHEVSPFFKIVDTTVDEKIFRGGKCLDKNKLEITKNLVHVGATNIGNSNSKGEICSSFEYILRRNDRENKNGLRWFLSPEEYIILHSD